MDSTTNFRTELTASAASPHLTWVEWLICAVACAGFAFDTYEIVVMSLVVRPAILELGPFRAGSAEFNNWVGLLLYVPSVAGGVFGLLGGYLTDRVGRRRVVVWSILLYCFSAVGTGFAASLPVLLVLRCTATIGVSVEFVAAVAWLAEYFQNPKQRESILGYTQAFSAVGGVLVTAAYFLAVTYAVHLPAIAQGHQAWRYALIFGTVPAIPLLVVRPFLPESPAWLRSVSSPRAKRPGISELFHPALRKTTFLSAAMAACNFGVAYGVIQQVPRIVPGLAGVLHLAPLRQEQIVSYVHLFTDLGNVTGRLLFAYLVVRIASQRTLLRLFLTPALAVFPLVFFLQPTRGMQLFAFGVGIATCLAIGQLSFWGNYLPRVYPTHLRGTGESFAVNIGGRTIGTFAVVLTTQLANLMPGHGISAQLAYAAGCVAVLAYSAALLASFGLPEPAHRELPE